MNDNPFDTAKGILFDLDGVMHVGNKPIDGAAETLRFLDGKSIPFRFVTNTTTQSPERLRQKMLKMGLAVEADTILTTHQVAAEYLAELGRPTCYLLVVESALSAYAGIPTNEENPEFVVIGDIGERWNYRLFNRVFNMVMDGADMIALHKGRYWKTEMGLRVDIGAFVTGLEYTTGKSAMVIGKPAPAFFEMAVKKLGLAKENIVMIGDDIETDVGGAQRAGIRAVLVKTGKYRDDAVARSTVQPDAILDSVADLPRFL